MTEIKGWHVLAMFIVGFAVIITANLTLAFSAIRTFPGLEVKNSYVASQSFEAQRDAQKGLNWTVNAGVSDGVLNLSVEENGELIEPGIVSATFGRATNVSSDQTPNFVFDGAAFRAPVNVSNGNWNLRIELSSNDGVRFSQRIPIWVRQ